MINRKLKELVPLGLISIFRSECFCGDSPPLESAKIEDELCDMKCPANPAETCGGYFTMNIFQTGLESMFSVFNKTFFINT